MDVNFVKFSCNDGATNMALDVKMLQEAKSLGQNCATARFYTWAPRCLSLGKNQPVIEIEEVDVVRRPTGGRALLHDMELTYCFVAPISKGDSVLDSYKKVSDGIIAGFGELGLELNYAGERSSAARYCMNISCGADISYKGKKLVGSAQFRSGGYFLQHGSILFDVDFDFIEKIFGQKVDRSSIITMGQIAPEITKEQLIEAISKGWKQRFKNEY